MVYKSYGRWLHKAPELIKYPWEVATDKTDRSASMNKSIYNFSHTGSIISSTMSVNIQLSLSQVKMKVKPVSSAQKQKLRLLNRRCTGLLSAISHYLLRLYLV